MWWTEKRGIIPRNFFGFRKSKSCYDCFANLQADIHLARMRNSFLGCIFLDLTSAYDNVNIFKLINMLNNLGVPPNN